MVRVVFIIEVLLLIICVAAKEEAPIKLSRAQPTPEEELKDDSPGEENEDGMRVESGRSPQIEMLRARVKKARSAVSVVELTLDPLITSKSGKEDFTTATGLQEKSEAVFEPTSTLFKSYHDIVYFSDSVECCPCAA